MLYNHESTGSLKTEKQCKFLLSGSKFNEIMAVMAVGAWLTLHSSLSEVTCEIIKYNSIMKWQETGWNTYQKVTKWHLDGTLCKHIFNGLSSVSLWTFFMGSIQSYFSNSTHIYFLKFCS
jgi:hypothetical protein